MKFDDFNYQVFNPYILVQEQKLAKEGQPAGSPSKRQLNPNNRDPAM